MVASGASRVGDAFGRSALAFGVLGRPGASAAQLSAVLVCVLLPTLLLTLPAGVVADRLPRYRLVALADLVSAAAWLGLARVLASGGPLVLVLAGALLAGSASAVAMPAQAGLLPDVVPVDGLQRANARLLVATRGADLLGTAAGGSVVALLGPPWALTLNAASFVVSACLAASLRRTGRRGPQEESGSFVGDLHDGWREFTGRAWLWTGTLAIATVSAAAAAGLGVLGTTYARDHWGGAQAWSVILTAGTMGMLCGALIVGRLRPRRPLMTAFGAAAFLAGPIALLALQAPQWMVAVAMFGSGVATDILGVLWATAMQSGIASTMISKVGAFDWLCSMTFVPVAVAAAGYLGGWLGVRPALAACALVILVTAATALATGAIRSAVDELSPAPPPRDVQ
jgi:hypothetical protein